MPKSSKSSRTSPPKQGAAARKVAGAASGAKAASGLSIRREGAVAVIRLNRPEKRNALADDMVLALGAYLDRLPPEVKAIVLAGSGEHFCAGLDLSMLKERSVAEGVMHSRMWHAVFDKLQFGRAPCSTCLLYTSPSLPPSTPCPRGSAAFLSAAAARCECRA